MDRNASKDNHTKNLGGGVKKGDLNNTSGGGWRSQKQARQLKRERSRGFITTPIGRLTEGDHLLDGRGRPRTHEIDLERSH